MRSSVVGSLVVAAALAAVTYWVFVFSPYLLEAWRAGIIPIDALFIMMLMILVACIVGIVAGTAVYTAMSWSGLLALGPVLGCSTILSVLTVIFFQYQHLQLIHIAHGMIAGLIGGSVFYGLIRGRCS